jgi:hypothetical protein
MQLDLGQKDLSGRKIILTLKSNSTQCDVGRSGSFFSSSTNRTFAAQTAVITFLWSQKKSFGRNGSGTPMMRVGR